MRFFSKRALLLAFGGLLLALLPLWHRLLAPVLRAPTIKAEPKQAVDAPTSGFSMDILSLVQFKEGQKEFMLSARRAVSKDTDNRILLSEVTAELYGKKQKPVRLRSGEALYDTPREEITLRRSVTIKTDDFTGATEELHYYLKSKLAQTSRKVEIRRSGLHITGYGLNFDVSAGDLVIGGHHGRVHCLLD